MSKWRRMKFPTDRWHPLTISDPVYGVNYIVLWNVLSSDAEVKRIINYIQKQWDITTGKDDWQIARLNNKRAHCALYDRGYVLILFSKEYRSGTNTLVHECFHVITAICDWRGIRVTLDNDEPMAYYIGWLCSAIATHGHKYKLWNT